MANNERVSQLVELFAADLRQEDLFLVTDMSQRESKKLELGQLLFFFESSGSFNAFNSAHADTASYVAAANVDGMVALANVASQSISSSWAFRAVSSSYSQDSSTASYASWCNTQTITADTASFLKYTGGPNGTSSYAIKAAASDTTTTAFNLFYNGTPNGTSSWAIRASNSNNSDTSSYSNGFSIGPWSSTSTIYPLTLRGATNDWANLFVSGTSDSGVLYIRTQDNGTEPIIFQSWNSDAGAVPVNRVSINYRNANSGSTIMTVHGEITASSFTSSISNEAGFHGTASHALSASALSPGIGGPKFITPVTVVSTTTSQSFTTFSASAYLPEGATTAILDCWVDNSTTNTLAFIYIRQDPSNPLYILTSFKSGGSGDSVSVGCQGNFPINSQRSFQYGITQASTVATIRLIGYY